MHTKYLHEVGQVIDSATFGEDTWQATEAAKGRVFYGKSFQEDIKNYEAAQQRVEKVETRKREEAEESQKQLGHLALVA